MAGVNDPHAPKPAVPTYCHQPPGTIRFGVDDDGRAWEAHVCGDAGIVGGVLDPRWTVHSTEPLTVTPSVHCRGCGLHGFITDGRWVPC